jgi:hypothetical protein
MHKCQAALLFELGLLIKCKIMLRTEGYRYPFISMGRPKIEINILDKAT